MKKIALLLLVFELAGCSSQKRLETTVDAPFEIGPSFSQQWSAGREEGGSGVQLKISILTNAEDISFDAIYFRGRALGCKLIQEEDQSYLTTSYKTDVGDTEDFEGKKMRATFELGPDEAIIAFSKAMNKTKYVKVSEIKQKRAVLYKGRLKN